MSADRFRCISYSTSSASFSSHSSRVNCSKTFLPFRISFLKTKNCDKPLFPFPALNLRYPRNPTNGTTFRLITSSTFQGNGDKIKTENGFLGVQPKKPEFATSHPLSNKKPFATGPPNVPQSFVLGGDGKGLQCTGQGYICVPKGLCVNGVVSETGELQQVRNEVSALRDLTSHVRVTSSYVQQDIFHAIIESFLFVESLY